MVPDKKLCRQNRILIGSLINDGKHQNLLVQIVYLVT